MKSSTATSRKIGWIVFTIGGVMMVGLGWLYSWWVVPAANQVGSQAYSGLLGFLWQLSVPLGAFLVAIGAGQTAGVERRVIWLLIVLFVLSAAWKIAYTSTQMIPALFGIGGGLITVSFIGSTWQWARIRPTLTKADRTGADLRMIGTIFFVVAAWFLCGLFGIADYALRPELAAKFSVPAGNTINSASYVLVMLALGWVFTFSGQLVSRQAQAAATETGTAPQIVAAD